MEEVFLKNCWYLAAWAGELEENGGLARRIAGEYILFLRDREGAARALADSCPHRLVPLSRGNCVAGEVTCAYHGLRFSADGRCVDNPHGPISSALRVRTYACVERHDALWLWLGDAPADPALIPDYGFIDRTPRAARVKGYLYSRSDYRLMVDNIMDLTHADYLHAGTLGGGINSRARMDARQDGDEVVIDWTAEDESLAPLHVRALGKGDGRGDFFNQVRWQAPGNMVQRIMLALPGEMATRPVDSMTCHVMTPETATSTHYFFCHTSDAVTADPAIAPLIQEQLVGAFAGEDAPMLAAQTERIGGLNFWDLKPALLPSDKGAVLARRTFDRMIEREREQPAAC